MPAQEYKCTNFAGCDKALTKEVIEIEQGQDLVCPGCNQETLEPLKGPDNGRKVPLRLMAIAGAVVAVLLLVWLFWPASPNADLANKMLSDFYPQLPK
jgi:DNA-directed RNA polymerase subunit RPC12/RpoP